MANISECSEVIIFSYSASACAERFVIIFIDNRFLYESVHCTVYSIANVKDIDTRCFLLHT